MKDQRQRVRVYFGAHLVMSMLALVSSSCGALSNDERPVTEVRYTQGGELVVLADRVLSVLDGELKRERLSFDLGPPNYSTQVLGVSNDGSVAAVGLNDSVAIFDLKIGKRIRTLSSNDLLVSSELPRLKVETIALSPDGQFLAVALQQSSNDEMAQVQPTPSNQTQWLSLYRVASGGRLWQISSPRPSNTAPTDGVPAMFAPPLFSEDGQRLFVRTWFQHDYVQLATDTGESIGPLVLAGAATNLFYPSTDRSRILGYSSVADPAGFAPTVWSAVDGSILRTFPSVHPNNCPATADLWIDESPSQQLFAGGFFSKCVSGSSSEVEVAVWNAEGDVLFRLPEPSLFSLTFSPDSANLAVAGGREGVSVYRLSDGKKLGNRKFDRKVF